MRNVKILGFAIAMSALINLAHARGEPPPPPTIYQRVGVDQKLDGQLPLDLVFKDETGATVKLDQYFHQGRPVVLALVYYQCPMLCTMTLNGMVKSFKPLKLDIGKDFDVLTISFDPTETPQLAAAKKATYLKSYNRSGAEAGWHFLTGDTTSIEKLTQSVGFRYTYDESSKQFAHASAIMVLTPQGKISRYFYGLEYSSRDLRLGLVEASQNKIGTVADAITLLCFHYDPTTAKYGLAIMTILRSAGILTLIVIGTYIFTRIRRERRAAAVPTPAFDPS